MNAKPPSDKVRLDKFLWAARFYKTRSLAAEEIDKGRVEVNGAAVKPAREVKLGDELRLRQGAVLRVVRVLALSHVRGPAVVAQTLFEETPDSIAARERAADQRRLSPEPALAQTQGRPTKRDRRDLERAKEGKGWDSRWSASIDD
jgi:ribosome-associated heat shock protein Hsp15